MTRGPAINSAGPQACVRSVDVNGAQAPHPQYIHFKRAVDPVAIERADQVVDAIDLDAIEANHDIARQKPGLAAGPSGSIWASSAPILLSTPADQRVPPWNRRGLSGHPDIGAAHIAVADDFRQHKLRGIAGDGETDALRAADDGGVDADHLGRGRHQRPAGVAGIERGIGLDHVLDGRPLTERIERPSAETTPAVTVDSKPRGLPIATTNCPRRRLLELPSEA